jgi:hypothetical protein
MQLHLLHGDKKERKEPKVLVLPCSVVGITLDAMTTITCKIPETLGATLESVARQRGVSKSQVVRESLEQILPVLSRKRCSSLHERWKHVCGMVRSGIPDLGSNPKHLEGFGAD